VVSWQSYARHAVLPFLENALRPSCSRGRGKLSLRSDDPRYMSHPEDWAEMRAAVRLTREIFAQPAFDRFRGAEHAPGPEIRTDAEIDAWIATNCESAYHPSGACKMGSDEMSVVDGACRVRGIEGLRVVDSSIMPSIVSGNLNAPTIMIAEKAADTIRGPAPLSPSNAPWHEGRSLGDPAASGGGGGSSGSASSRRAVRATRRSSCTRLNLCLWIGGKFLR
jgi:hypothetical protein